MPHSSFSLKLSECGDVSLSILSVVALAFVFIGLSTPQARAQTETLSPLTEDQDGDGNLVNEEEDISLSCNDFKLNQSHQDLGMVMNMTFSLSEDNCDFVMQYLSGQCEKQNVEDVCNLTLMTYLMEKGLLHNTDYPQIADGSMLYWKSVNKRGSN